MQQGLIGRIVPEAPLAFELDCDTTHTPGPSDACPGVVVAQRTPERWMVSASPGKFDSPRVVDRVRFVCGAASGWQRADCPSCGIAQQLGAASYSAVGRSAVGRSAVYPIARQSQRIVIQYTFVRYTFLQRPGLLGRGTPGASSFSSAGSHCKPTAARIPYASGYGVSSR
jgi:hypothetical protein